DNAFGGSMCSCVFTQLHPKFTITRTTGLPQNAIQGSSGVPVRVEGSDFPFDLFFGQGLSFAKITATSLDAPGWPSAFVDFVAFVPDSPDTVAFASSFIFPNLGLMHPG